MPKANCWEAKGCGREPGGAKVMELGICPAATATALDGVHGGKNGGRACWVTAGTMCEGRVRCSSALLLNACQACDFYQAVRREEGGNIIPSWELLRRTA